ncbi:hypothetical protein HPB50_005875 [Hyalomma asiaticum]|uniref:Uncharacterized protein n=1 Tax=Hyalomma asiaticum TaxID=266040 RepID=A0ACB7S4H9_HYAAI|nr:hypothetical protein HPB50_005875 [Hyalomma asiaticum]
MRITVQPSFFGLEVCEYKKPILLVTFVCFIGSKDVQQSEPTYNTTVQEGSELLEDRGWHTNPDHTVYALPPQQRPVRTNQAKERRPHFLFARALARRWALTPSWPSACLAPLLLSRFCLSALGPQRKDGAGLDRSPEGRSRPARM